MNTLLPQVLAARLANRPAWPTADSVFLPRPAYWQHYDRPPAEARSAAVLVLLYPHEGAWYMPLILRPSHLGVHAGQIGLPGGAIEVGESSMEAAMREFREELGMCEVEIESLGRLTPLYVRSSNYLIEPWVGAAARRPAMVPQPAEVDALLEVPLAHLRDPANLGCHERVYQGRAYTAPHLGWQSYRIWGATCMILGELITCLEGVEL